MFGLFCRSLSAVNPNNEDVTRVSTKFRQVADVRER
jgi:hypothetical protein